MLHGRIEGEIAVNGFTAVLLDYVHERSDERRLASDAAHVLGMTITRERAYSQVSFDRSEPACRFVDIRHPVFLPVATPLVARISQGHERSIEVAMAPARFAEITGHGADWKISDLEVCADIRDPRIEEPLMRLAQEIACPGFAAATLVEAVSIGLAVDLARYLRRPTPGVRAATGLGSGDLARIRAAIEDSGARLPTIADLAVLCGMSERHLMRTFKAATGETIKAYVERVRLARAKAMLSRTDLLLKEIAARLGFASLSGFSVAFRRLAGETPTEFRRHFRRATPGWADTA